MSSPNWLQAVASWATIGACAVGIALLQPRVMHDYLGAEATTDMYALPKPLQSVVMSLGHRAAFADYLYGVVRVSYGSHVRGKRRYEFMEQYLDTITTLDPTFVDPYLYADTFLTLQVGTQKEDYYAARRILQRGLKALPYNQRLWTTAGQFMAYLAPPRLKDPKEQKEWRLEGAQVLAHACSLASKNKNLPYHCIVAASLLHQAGQRAAAIRALQDALTVQDDPEIRRIGLGYLRQKLGEEEREKQERRYKQFENAWKSDLGFVSKEMILVLGPGTDAARCAGPTSDVTDGGTACVTTWRAWREHQAY